MGKYMRKTNSNNGAEVSVNFMDISKPLGVRTRAKTLASKTQKTTSSSAVNSSSFGYLQLRSRRLLRLKPPVFKQSRKSYVDDFPNSVGNPNLCDCSSPAGSSANSRVRVGVCTDSPNSGDKLVSVSAVQSANDCKNGDEFDDTCCGENVMESDLRERSTRESTPSNMIRDPDSIHTPGSTTRPVSSAEATRRLPSSSPRDIPTSHEMEEFFADAEEQQQKEFIQKYNFDPVNDKPLVGRYEWKKVKP